MLPAHQKTIATAREDLAFSSDAPYHERKSARAYTGSPGVPFPVILPEATWPSLGSEVGVQLEVGGYLGPEPGRAEKGR